jgi:5-methylcytosine-specific restriction endonuclease McrA
MGRTFVRGDVTIRLEEFEHTDKTKRDRPVSVTVNQVHRCTVGDRAATPTPIAMYQKENRAWDGQIPIDMDYGHLVALELGGPNNSENIVLLNAHVNRRGNWKALERKAGKEHSITHFTIKLEYNFTDKRVPSALVATLKGWDQNQKETVANLMTAEPTIYQIDEQFKKFLASAQEEVAKGWSIAKWADANKLPCPVVPATPGPYAALDYLVLVGIKGTKLLDPPVISNGYPFSEAQAHWIWMANAIRNGGNIKSDGQNDQYQGPLSLMGGDTYPEIDHIVAKTQSSGSNAYSNAQVLSGRTNKAKSGKSI